MLEWGSEQPYFVGQLYGSLGKPPAYLVGAVEIVNDVQQGGGLYGGQRTMLPLPALSLPVRVRVRRGPERPLRFRFELKKSLGLGKELVPKGLWVPRLGTAVELTVAKL